MKSGTGLILFVLAQGLTGCDSARAPLPGPSPGPQPPQPALVTFTERATGFSTTDLYDVQGQVVQINTANELIWTPDGTRLPGYRLGVATPYYEVPFVDGQICPEGCSFELRFGSKDGVRRAYLTLDYGHYNPGTLVDVELAGGALVVTQTDVYPPGAPTLSGMVTEMTSTGPVPIEGVSVNRLVTSGWREGTTDRNGFYRIPGVLNGTTWVEARKEGYRTEKWDVLIAGDARFDIQLVRR